MPIKKVHRAKIAVQDEVVEVQCNKCRSIIPEDDWRSGSSHPLALSGGYSSSFPGDCVTCTFVLCDACAKELVESFAIPAEFTGGFGYREPYTAKREAAGEEVLIDGGWVRDSSISDDEFWALAQSRELEALYQKLLEAEIDWPVVANPYAGIEAVHEHYKGRLYQVIETDLFDLESHEPMVVYRALYGESEVWVRPVREFIEDITRGTYSGPRFVHVQLAE